MAACQVQNKLNALWASRRPQNAMCIFRSDSGINSQWNLRAYASRGLVTLAQLDFKSQTICDDEEQDLRGDEEDCKESDDFVNEPAVNKLTMPKATVLALMAPDTFVKMGQCVAGTMPSSSSEGSVSNKTLMLPATAATKLRITFRDRVVIMDLVRKSRNRLSSKAMSQGNQDGSTISGTRIVLLHALYMKFLALGPVMFLRMIEPKLPLGFPQEKKAYTAGECFFKFNFLENKKSFFLSGRVL